MKARTWDEVRTAERAALLDDGIGRLLRFDRNGAAEVVYKACLRRRALRDKLQADADARRREAAAARHEEWLKNADPYYYEECCPCCGK